jgi:hypothetical protein
LLQLPSSANKRQSRQPPCWFSSKQLQPQLSRPKRKPRLPQEPRQTLQQLKRYDKLTTRGSPLKKLPPSKR